MAETGPLGNVEQAAAFRSRLLRWYRRHKRDLPWRKTRDPYKIWISEIMLQQTTVRAVLPYYLKWIEVFPDITALGEAPLRQVLKLWEGLGYYQRARNLHEAARRILADHNGCIPRSYQEALALPGFGPYTTAAVLSLAYNRPHPVLDANVRRLMMRIERIHGQALAAVDKRIHPLLRRLMTKRNPGEVNQALMELGALICRPRNPSCLSCPVSDGCLAFHHGEQEVIPTPKSLEITRIEAAVAVLQVDGRCFLQKRPSNGLLADLWEFPGGKLLPGETPEDALHREIREELGIELEDCRFLTRLRHDYTRYRVTLHAFLCRPASRPKVPREKARWITLRGLRRFPVPSGTARLIRFLENRSERPGGIRGT